MSYGGIERSSDMKWVDKQIFTGFGWYLLLYFYIIFLTATTEIGGIKWLILTLIRFILNHLKGSKVNESFEKVQVKEKYGKYFNSFSFIYPENAAHKLVCLAEKKSKC